MTRPTPAEKWQLDLKSGDIVRVTNAARELVEQRDDPRKDFIFEVYDKYWRRIDVIGEDLIEASGTDPRNDLGSAVLKIKGGSWLTPIFRKCVDEMVGIVVETQGMRWAFYVDKFEESYENGEWTGIVHCLSIWDILNYMIIWPSWFLPIQVQPWSHAIYFGPICTVLEAMAVEQAMRIQTGLWELVNQALSFNPDFRAWFGTVFANGVNPIQNLKTPMYVVRTNPFLDTSPIVVRTVRMEAVGAVYKDIARSYGVDIRVDLWMPGDPQPDIWTTIFPFLSLNQPTYVLTVKDRQNVVGPTGTILDSVLRTVVDLGGSLLGDMLFGLIREVPGFDGTFEAPLLGVDFVEPWTIVVAPDPGQKGALVNCKISHHTQKGWMHIAGGRSPQWLNRLINALLSWLIDAIQILIGITGFGNMLEGFLNNAFFAFQQIQLFERRMSAGPYHPCIETFTATGNPPYNVETLFFFINKFWDTRGYTSATFTFRNGEPYYLGKDVIRGGLVSLVFAGRTKIYTDYVENILWKISETERDVLVQVGDGKAEEAPLAKHQRNITGAFEAVNVALLTPQS